VLVVAGANTSKPTPQEYYTKVWKLVDDNFLYRERLSNWSSWEHKFDGKLKSQADAEKAVNQMLDSLKDPYTYFKDAAVTRADQDEDDETNVVEWKLLSGNIGYIAIHTFGSNHTTDEVKAALIALKDADAYIIDVRDNGGGYVHEALGVFSLLVDQGSFTTLKGRYEGKTFNEEYSVTATEILDNENGVVTRASRNGTNLTGTKPIIVLVNGDTASASEMLSGALRDHGRAELLGTKTFGKGIAQITWSLGYGTSVQITFARYYLPKGASIHGGGITPDYVRNKGPQSGDTQLESSLRLIKSKLGR
jgi:carboxyl-terminal processing protease